MFFIVNRKPFRTDSNVRANLGCAAIVIGFFICLALQIPASLANDSRSPLADAAEKLDLPKLRALLQNGADVNAAQVDGMTAMHWAAYQDDFELAKLLVDAGA